ALRHHALLLRIDRPVSGGHHVPGGLGLPGGIRDLVRERVSGDRHLRYSHEVGHGRRNVRREVGREMRLVYPPVAGAVRLERLRGLWHSLFDRRTALTFIERKGSDVDQCRNLWVVAGLRDVAPAITVADDYPRPVHGVDGRLRVLDVLGVGGLGGLRHRDRVAILLEDLGDGFPTRSIGNCTMHQDHVLDASEWCGCGGDNLLAIPEQQRCDDQRGCERSNTAKLFHGYFPLRLGPNGTFELDAFVSTARTSPFGDPSTHAFNRRKRTDEMLRTR